MPFAEESPARSWWNVGSTVAILLALLGCAAVAPWWPLRLAASITGGLVMVRTFILYHDYARAAAALALQPQLPSLPCG